MIKKYLNLNQGSNRFFVVWLCLSIFSSNMLHAQVDNGNQLKVVLKDGARIFSADDNFNKQILAGKIVLKNSDISYKKIQGKANVLKLVARRSQKQVDETLQNQLKLADNKKAKDALQKVKKEIEKFEERINAFDNFDFAGIPASNQFFSSHTISKNYVAPSYSNHDLSKLFVFDDTYFIKRALDFLHAQKYTYYNTRSLDYCYSEVFSVRPPPVI